MVFVKKMKKKRVNPKRKGTVHERTKTKNVVTYFANTYGFFFADEDWRKNYDNASLTNRTHNRGIRGHRHA